jgi:FkbM family methyltransferase
MFLAQYGFFYSNYLKHYATNFCFVDVGANQGLFSIIAAKNVKCDEVISFEPIKSTYDYLVKNCQLNNVTNKCYLHNLAIGDSNENISIFFNKNHSGKSSLVKSNQNHNNKMVKIETINSVKLNKLLTIKNKNYILKIDVEGYEFVVLKQLFKCNFAKFITSIFYEIDKRWHDVFLIEKFLRGHGFNSFKKIGKGSHFDIMASK